MGNQAKRNYRSGQVVVSTSYVEVTDTGESYFSVMNTAQGLWLSIGHDTPSDATSVPVPAGAAFDLPTGVVGPVFVRSLTGTETTAYTVIA